MNASLENSNKLNLILSWLHPLAKKAAVDFDFYTFKTENSDVTFQKSALKNYSSSKSCNFILRVLKGEKCGVSYIKSLEKNNIEDCFQQAMQGLYLSDKADAGDISGNTNYPDLSATLCSSEEDLSLADKIEIARKLNQSSLSVDSRIKPIHNIVQDIRSTVQYGNSKNHQGTYQSSFVQASSYSLAVDQEKRGQGISEASARSYAEIDFKKLGQESAKKSLKKLSFTIPKTDRYPVIFHACQPAPVLLNCLVQHMNGKTVVEKLSLLGKSLHQFVFSEHLNIYDDSLAAWGAGARPFDAEGFSSKKWTLVKQGVLENYLTSSFFSKALDVPHTAHASWESDIASEAKFTVSPTNIEMQAGSHLFSELVKTFPKGIIIDDLKGMAGYNSTSGNFSIESEGFLWTASGELQPICQFVVSANIIDVFKNILKLSKDSVIYNGRVKAPSFLVPSLSIAGK